MTSYDYIPAHESGRTVPSSGGSKAGQPVFMPRARIERELRASRSNALTRLSKRILLGVSERNPEPLTAARPANYHPRYSRR